MPLSRAVLFVTRDTSKLFGVPSFYLSTFKLSIKIKVRKMQEDFIFNVIYKIWQSTSPINRRLVCLSRGNINKC